VASIKEGKMPGQIDRYNMRRMVSMTANIRGDDLGMVAGQIEKAIQTMNKSLWVPQQGAEGKEGWKKAITENVVYQRSRPSEPPGGMIVEARGQVLPMQQMFRGLAVGLAMAVAVIFLLLTAYFQSVRLALIVVSTAPIVVAGVFLALVATRTTLNIQ